MKILVSTYHNPRFWTVSEYVERAVRSLGHTLIPFEDRRFLVPGRLRERIPALQACDLQRINNRLLDLVRSERPDLCLVLGGYRMLPGTVDAFRRMNVPAVLWTIDVPHDFGPLERSASLYDRVYCGGSEAVGILKAHGAHDPAWLPFACDAELHGASRAAPEELAPLACDIAFVGTVDPRTYPFRVSLLEALRDFDLGIWGPGAPQITAGSPLAPHVRGGMTGPETWTKIYRAAKIVLCMHYRDPAGKISCDQASPRVYEALACGAFLLVDRQKDARALFEDGKHCVFFDGPDDLREKAAYYIAHPRERERIAAAGRAEVLAKHTYRRRLETLLSATGVANASSS